MDVPTITCDPKVAREKLRAYRRARHKDAEAEYAAAAAAYEQLAEGRALISLTDAILAGGFYAEGPPRLAVARADRRQVRYTRYRWQRQIRFDGRANYYAWEGVYSQMIVDIHSPRLPKVGSNHVSEAFATVPMVPADVRPKTGQLRHWWILWHVERWHLRPIIDPPTDPILLEHVHGDLYAVLAAWDLTDVERAVMRDVLA